MSEKKARAIIALLNLDEYPTDPNGVQWFVNRDSSPLLYVSHDTISGVWSTDSETLGVYVQMKGMVSNG